MPQVPTVSVIVPTYRRPQQLVECLKALSKQDYDRECWELIVVDDGGNELAENLLDLPDLPGSRALIHKVNGGPASARNAGAARAVGKFLVFIDDDCICEKNWLSEMVKALNSNPDSLIGGRTENAFRSDVYMAASQLLLNCLREYYLATTSKINFFSSNNMACSARCFNSLGGFDPEFRISEDRDLGWRWSAAGLPLAYAQAAVVRHCKRLNLLTFCRQHFNYGCGSYNFHTKRSRLEDRPIKIEPLRFYWQLIAYPCKHSVDNRYELTVLLALSQLTIGFGFMFQMLRLKFSRPLVRRVY